MRLIRKLIFGIIGLVLTIAIALLIVFAIAYDDSKCSIDLSKEYRTIDTIMADDIYDSLSNINKNNYEKDKNNISIGFSQDEINYYLVEAIRKSVNPKYLDGEDYIVKDSNYALQTFEFQINEDVMTLKFRMNIYFYQTSIKLSAKLSIDNKLLRFNLESAKLGFLPMPIDVLKSTMQNLEFKISENSKFDASKFEFTIAIEDLLKTSSENDILTTILNNCDYSISVKDNKLRLSIDTNKIFKQAQSIPAASDLGLSDLLNQAEIEASSDPEYHYSCTITEANFNYLIMNNINSAISGYNESFTLASKTFNFKIDKMAYDISKEAFVSNLFICDTSSPIEIGISINPISEGGVVKKLGVAMGNIKLGDLENTSLKLIDFGDIDIGVLGFDKVTINSIDFDKVNRNIKISGIYHNS